MKLAGTCDCAVAPVPGPRGSVAVETPRGGQRLAPDVGVVVRLLHPAVRRRRDRRAPDRCKQRETQSAPPTLSAEGKARDMRGVHVLA